jgi:ATP-binding cassette subfamily B protein
VAERWSEDEAVGRAWDLRLMRRLWRFTRPHRRLVWVSLVLFPAAAAVELAQPWLVMVAIDEHILRGDWAGLGRVAALFLLTLVVLYALRAAQAYVMQEAGQRVMHDLRQALFAHLQRMDAAFFDRHPLGRLMTRVLNDVEAINELFVSGVVVVVGDLVTLAGVVAILLTLHARLALVTLALVPLLALVAVSFRLRAREAYRRVRTRLAAVAAALQEGIQGVPTIQALGRQEAEARLFARDNAGLRAAQFRSTLFEAGLYAGVEALGGAAVALLLWWGGGEVLAGTLTFGALVAFLEYTHRFFLPIRDLGAKYTVMQAATVSAERIFGLLDTEPAIRPPSPGRRPAPVPPAARGAGAPTPAVEFRNVWFAYAREAWVLRDCSFTVEPGETVALVGPTGGGKTTVARLCLRAWDVARGQVLVDGRDVRDWDLTALRRHVGLVPQEVFLFAGTVEANLTLGADGAVSADDVARTLTLANAEAVVHALPGGLREPIGERGGTLSQGQRQLLAMARALIYNPRVLVLDEATSSVDPASERLIRDALPRLFGGRANLVIAHRLSTVQAADRILVLSRGRVREAGRHADLVARGGLYARLVEAQLGRAHA